LELAHFNAKANEVKVNFIEANMLEWNSNQDFDVVVSNPPYVCKQEQELMKDNVLAYEPHLALFVPDEAPLVFYKALKDIALNNLKSSGLCFAEINEQYGNETKALFDALNFENRVIKKDTFGKDRMLKAQKK
jgi:release factor glutamine methyltransferase